MQNLSEVVLNKFIADDYIGFKIQLNTPYKWGVGWNKEQSTRIMPKILSAILQSNDNDTFWKLEDRDDYGFSSPVLVNILHPFEELYVHPMELSGVTKRDNLYFIVDNLQCIVDDEFSVGDILYCNVVQDHTLDTLLSKLKQLPQKDFDKVKDEYSDGYLPGNLADNLPYYFNDNPLQLKQFGIAYTEENEQLRVQKELVFHYFSHRCFPTQKNKENYCNFCEKNNLKTSLKEAPKRDVKSNAQVADKMANMGVDKKI